MSNDLPTKINVDVDELQVPVRRLGQSILVTYRLDLVTRNAYAVPNDETATTSSPPGYADFADNLVLTRSEAERSRKWSRKKMETL